ncbi:proline dehydrogenase family protein [Modestobacter italicus]|uniref:proline dehydrogenase family protein n=1 Tax=Modestobacter italicus (strain DSM 44449 / CECT 9708 / BC 501) TaxID=2732864 RepID=UPI001C980170|nr:proline dehydrogenase family protein [Modestobacter italicus]
MIAPEAAADALRAWALDEQLKQRVMADPALAALAARVARRYTAGDTVPDAIAAAQAAVRRGHAVSIEYAGESVRDADLARAETAVFLDLIATVRAAGLPSTVSFDLSHVGSVVAPALAAAHVREMAAALAPVGTELMISAEGSGRTDLVLDLYDELAGEGLRVGVTLQARLHRTPADLDRVLRHPGTVRLVKGAFLEPDGVAHRRGSAELTTAYLGLARRLVQAGHPVSVATHDETLVRALVAEHGTALTSGPVEFEMLLGLGPDLLDALHREGFRTREYVVFGGEWWLYVLNRIAEDPARVFTALTDLAGR